MAARRRIGLLGGTFDPIHVGHLALARAAREALRLDEVRFIPTGQSWQKSGSGVDAAARLQMVRLAVGPTPGFVVDDREVRRAGASYTIDTLIELRAELGPGPALVLVLGSDQLRNLATWHRYRELLDHAHIAATQRGTHPLATLDAPVEALLAAHGRDALPDAPAGAIVYFRMAPVPVSATALRERLARGERPAELLPPAVLDYIERHRLYRAAAGSP
ncbi:MAG TPA: nicotinate-nucleotide adenylyltransferase [Burkholderiaceae bacterium]|nr:nicotinate-nucleotide adenylyltransferase [Burkholderiaceae bacterium]